MNAPINNMNLLAVSRSVDIPVVITVVDEKTDIGARLEAGANAITYTPPSPQEMFNTMMAKYREL